MSEEKPRLVRVTDPVEIEAVKAGASGDIGCPLGHWYNEILLTSPEPTLGKVWYADAAEMAKWRAGRAKAADEV